MRLDEAAFRLTEPEEIDVDPERRKTRERWLASYSPKALKQGIAIDNSVVQHQRFKQLVQCLDRMFLLSKELRQPVGGVIRGTAGVGKSTLCQYFLDTLPTHDLAERGSGVLYLRLRRGRSLGAVVQQILTLLDYPAFKISRDNLDARRSISLVSLRRHKIRLLLVDEAHQLMLHGMAQRDDGSAISEYLREIMDEAQIAVCLVGGVSLSEIGRVDPYLESRCVVNEVLKDFQLDDAWLSLVQSLMPSNETLDFKQLQSSREIRERIYKSSGGNLRRLKQYLAELAMTTAEAGKKSPDSEEFRVAYQRAFGNEGLQASPWL